MQHTAAHSGSTADPINQELLDLGLKPITAILEQPRSLAEARKAERHWIAKFRADGHKLTNSTDGGDGIAWRFNRPQIAQLREEITFANIYLLVLRERRSKERREWAQSQLNKIIRTWLNRPSDVQVKTEQLIIENDLRLGPRSEAEQLLKLLGRTTVKLHRARAAKERQDAVERERLAAEQRAREAEEDAKRKVQQERVHEYMTLHGIPTQNFSLVERWLNQGEIPPKVLSKLKRPIY